MSRFSVCFHRLLCIWGFCTSASILREALVVSARIRPYTSMGWRLEQAEVFLAFLFPLGAVIATARGGSGLSKAVSAVSLGALSFVAYKRYFSLNFELLATACFLDGCLQLFPQRHSSWKNYAQFLLVVLLTVLSSVFFIAGHFLVGA